MSKIKKIAPLFLLLAVLLLTQSCMKVETEVNVNKDGSGTIDVTMLFAGSMMMFLQSMDPESKGEKKEENPFSREKFEEVARSYGEEVKLVEYKELKDGQYIGGKGSFTFPDINTVAIALVPDMEGESSSNDDNITFEFNKKGQNRKLKVFTPAKDEGAEQESSADGDGEEGEDEPGSSAEQMEMMKGFMKDMYISFRVNVKGKIVKTNSKNVNKSQVTLYEIDMNKIIADEEMFKIFSESNNDAEKMSRLNGREGLIIEPNEVIEIDFR